MSGAAATPATSTIRSTAASIWRPECRGRNWRRGELMGNQTTRDHIIEAADQLFYRQGFEHTSFSDIASVVQISRGNFYFHFKTKDEILDAVINRRLADTRKMLDRWEIQGEQPADPIPSFIHILIAHPADIERYSCP